MPGPSCRDQLAKFEPSEKKNRKTFHDNRLGVQNSLLIVVLVSADISLSADPFRDNASLSAATSTGSNCSDAQSFRDETDSIAKSDGHHLDESCEMKRAIRDSR